MSSPALHVLAGPNGSGKTTFVEHVLEPVTHLLFVNADMIAASRWPGQESAHAYEASEAASAERDRLMEARRSFIAETVFSHPTKVDLVARAAAVGYIVELHIMLVPEELAVARVAYRVSTGGHTVPEQKVRERYRRLWPLVREATAKAARVTVYDNSRAARPFRPVAAFEQGQLVGVPDWPAWTPEALTRSRPPAARRS